MGDPPLLRPRIVDPFAILDWRMALSGAPRRAMADPNHDPLTMTPITRDDGYTGIVVT